MYFPNEINLAASRKALLAATMSPNRFNLNRNIFDFQV